MVHLHSSQLLTPDGIISAFSHDAYHNRSLRMQLRVVWYLRLIDDTVSERRYRLLFILF